MIKQILTLFLLIPLYIFQKYLTWIKRAPVRGTIISLVTFFHLFILLFWSSSKEELKKTHPHFSINTVYQKKEAPSTPSTKTSKGSSQTAKPSKKPEPKKTTAKKTTPSPAQKIPQKVLDEIEESIAKIDTNRDKLIKADPNKKEKVMIPKLVLSQSDLGSEIYNRILMEALEESLHLPELGEIKVELTLKRDGSIVKLNFLKSESKKNKTYLEKNLPSLNFPPFDEAYLGKESHTFILNFQATL